MELQPLQFGNVYANDKGVHGQNMNEMADHYYSTEPTFMNHLENDIRQNGFQEPVHVEMRDHPTSLLQPRQPWIVQGHHRAAVGARLGIPVPAFSNSRDEFPAMRASMQDPDNKARTQQWHDLRRQVPDEETERKRTTGNTL